MMHGIPKRPGWPGRRAFQQVVVVVAAGAVVGAGLQACSSDGDDANVDGGQVDPDGGVSAAPEDVDRLPAGELRFDRAAYLADLTFIEGERTPGSEHWQAVQDLCADRLEALGFDVERDDFGAGVNVLGTMVGRISPDSHVIIGAHYDHIEGCPGADDNGTGVAGTLEVARMLAAQSQARTLVVACWDQEEFGLLGSAQHAAALAMEGAEVVAAVSMEMIGYATDEPNTQEIPLGFPQVFPAEVAVVEANDRRGNFIILIGNTPSAGMMADMQAAGTDLDLPSIILEASDALGPTVANLVRSDHASYWLQGMPAVMVTDGANFRNPNYHCGGGPDTIDSLNHEFAGKVTLATAQAVRRALRP